MPHVYTLDALMSASAWTTKTIAFLNGSSLHLSWRSPRHSEDLDFLIANDVGDLDEIMRSLEKRVQEHFVRLDPAAKVDIKSKTKNEERMPACQIVISRPARTGKVMVKVEFWRVDKEYLQNYPTEFKTPLATGDVVSNAIIRRRPRRWRTPSATS